MGKIHICHILKIEILFVFMFFLLFGCKTMPTQQPAAKKGALDDVLVFRDLQQVDLDNDGVKDIVAIYATPDNLSGVKAVRFHDGKGEVVFEYIFDTPNVKFAMKDSKPTLIVEQKDEATGCTGGRIKSVYQWDGKAFTSAGKTKK